MFDFENLKVYSLAKNLSLELLMLLKDTKSPIDTFIRDQLKRSSTSIFVNIAEGSGRFSKTDKRHFYVIARGSAYETVSFLGLLKDENNISLDIYKSYYARLEEISKMLLGLIKSQR
jgi:four helix bundle protein